MRALLLATLFAAFALPACGGEAASDPSADPTTQDELKTGSSATLHDADNGKTVTVAKGKDVTVVLSSNPTTGYTWKVVSTDRSFGYPTPKDGSFSGAGAGGPVGAGGAQTFVWKTGSPFIEAGGAAHAVTLEYRRSFESEDKPAAKTFKFKVKITAGSATTTPEPAAPEPSYECPTQSSINCMPPVSASKRDVCDHDYRAWAQQNCDVQYLD